MWTGEEGRKTERQKDRETDTERQKDRKKERQRDRDRMTGPVQKSRRILAVLQLELTL